MGKAWLSKSCPTETAGMTAILLRLRSLRPLYAAVLAVALATFAYDGHFTVAAKGTARAPDFIVSRGGTVFPVPAGASGPIPATTGKGFQFVGGSGGHGLSPKTTDVRFMDPVTSGKYQYPTGYGSYGNGAQPVSQTINPYTGKTLAPSDPWWHIPAQ